MVIEHRLDEIKALKGKHEFLPRDEVTADIKNTVSLIRSGDSVVRKTMERDFSDADRSEILHWLHNLGIGGDKVKVYWVSNLEGIRIQFEDFASNYDELWHPGADDVIVISSERTWILELNHEEIFSFYERRESHNQ